MFRTALKLQSRTVGHFPRVVRPLGVAGTIQMRFNSSSTETAAQLASEIKSEIAAIGTSSPTAVEAVVEMATKVSPDQVGYFQSVGLAQNWYWPPDIFQHIFEYSHIYTGLPWWATIGIVTLGMRVVMFPMYYKAADTTAKFSSLQPEMQKILEDYQKSKDPIDGQKALLRRKKLMAEHNIKYRWLLAPVMGAPFFIGIFAGLNRMSHVPVQGFLDEGMLWFSNLSVADPYLGLQVLTALVYSATFRLGGEMGATPTASAMKKILPWLPFIAIPLTMQVPAATCLYFTFNGVLSCIQAACFQSPTIRQAIGLAPIVKHKATSNENTIDSIKTMFREMNEKAQEQARKTKEELEVKRQHELEQARIESRKFIQVEGRGKKQSKVASANKGKKVSKGKELRL